MIAADRPSIPRPITATTVDHPVLKAEAIRRPGSWYVRRAVFGILIMGVAVAGGVWLLNASIDAEAGDGSKFGTIQD